MSSKAWKRANPEKLRVHKHTNYLNCKADPVRHTKQLARVKAWKKANPEKVAVQRKRWWKRKQGVAS